MEPSDFTSILARWTPCTLMATFRVWLSLYSLFSAYPLLGSYPLTTYTYKHMRLLTWVYGISKLAVHTIYNFTLNLKISGVQKCNVCWACKSTTMSLNLLGLQLGNFCRVKKWNLHLILFHNLISTIINLSHKNLSFPDFWESLEMTS